jgi:hypothetical protein
MAEWPNLSGTAPREGRASPARVLCHSAICPNRRCPCLEVIEIADGHRVVTFPDSNTGEPGADELPSYKTFVGIPADRRLRSLVHAIGSTWRVLYWPDRHAAVHGHEAVVGRLIQGQPINDLGM